MISPSLGNTSSGLDREGVVAKPNDEKRQQAIPKINIFFFTNAPFYFGETGARFETDLFFPEVSFSINSAGNGHTSTG